MVEGDQGWNRSAQGQFRASYTADDAAIDRAIAETYGGGSSQTLRDTDGNRQGAPKASQPKTSRSGSGNRQSSGKRDKSRGQSATRTSANGKSPSNKATEKEKWIHRDKLAQIEVQEYREAGLEPPQQLLRVLAESRAEMHRDDTEALARIKSSDMEQFSDAHEDMPEDSYHEQYEQYGQDENDQDDNEIYGSGEHTDTNMNGAPSPRYTAGATRHRSNSRIPLATQDSFDTPSNKRSVGSTGDSESIGYPKLRARKGSVGSQAVLDDEPDTPTSSSPSKQRVPSSKGKGKFNTISTVPRTRTTSAGRPGTADGKKKAVKRPEGDPPWLATMYKPDPRLPPDQQMLPTHAKRLHQEQLAKEGKSAQTFDRELNPLAQFDDDSEAARMQAAERPQEAEQGLGIETGTGSDWPLRASRTPSPTKKSTPVLASGDIPRVTDSPKPAVGLFPSPRPGDQPIFEAARPFTRNGTMGQHDEQFGPVTRVTGGLEDPEKGKQEKKRGACGCCVVM